MSIVDRVHVETLSRAVVLSDSITLWIFHRRTCTDFQADGVLVSVVATMVRDLDLGHILIGPYWFLLSIDDLIHVAD